MLRLFLYKPKNQLRIIALSLFALSTILGLSAFLTKTTDTLTSTFKMMYGTEFGVSINTKLYSDNQVIVPGGEIVFDPYLENSGNYPVYVFLVVTLPDITCCLSGLDSKWTRLDAITDQAVFAYGSATDLTELQQLSKLEDGSLKGDETEPLCTGIALDSDTDLNEGILQAYAVGYAVQTTVGTSDPLTVWRAICEKTTSTATDIPDASIS